MENLCVLNCRPSIFRWQGKRVVAMRRRAVAALAASGGRRNASRRAEFDADDEGYTDAVGGPEAASAASPSLYIAGTSARPPKASSAFAYPLARRDADRQECCRVDPKASKCEAPSLPPPPPARA